MTATRNILLSLVFVLALVAGAYGSLEPANRLQVTVAPLVILDSSHGTFKYRYTLANSPSSIQRVYHFDLTVGPKEGVTKYLAALDVPAWDIALAGEYDPLNATVLSWLPFRKLKRYEEFFEPPPASIKPGGSVKGFGVDAKNLPGIRFFWATGWVRPLRAHEVTAEVNRQKGTDYSGLDVIPRSILREVDPDARPEHENAFQGHTVGPDILPENKSVSDLLDRLIALKEQALNMKWIDSAGVANSLNKKLAHAKRRLNEGMLIPAINILHAFIHELQAQQGKHVNDNAFALLKANAEFLIFKLESR